MAVALCKSPALPVKAVNLILAEAFSITGPQSLIILGSAPLAGATLELVGSDIAQPAEGWYGDPTGRHELRWFSDGTATELVRDAGADSKDALSGNERALRANAGPGLELPQKSGVAWRDTAIPKPGEPTVADVGITGWQVYELTRGIRLANRLHQRGRLWWLAALALAGVILILVLMAA